MIIGRFRLIFSSFNCSSVRLFAKYFLALLWNPYFFTFNFSYLLITCRQVWILTIFKCLTASYFTHPTVAIYIIDVMMVKCFVIWERMCLKLWPCMKIADFLISWWIWPACLKVEIAARYLLESVYYVIVTAPSKSSWLFLNNWLALTLVKVKGRGQVLDWFVEKYYFVRDIWVVSAYRVELFSS